MFLRKAENRPALSPAYYDTYVPSYAAQLFPSPKLMTDSPPPLGLFPSPFPILFFLKKCSLSFTRRRSPDLEQTLFLQPFPFCTFEEAQDRLLNMDHSCLSRGVANKPLTAFFPPYPDRKIVGKTTSSSNSFSSGTRPPLTFPLVRSVGGEKIPI